MRKTTNCHLIEETNELNDHDGDYNEYFDNLYSIFIDDLIKSPPIFKGKPVNPRYYPAHEGKPESYYHLTHDDYFHTGYENRVFDPRRSERLHWIKPILQNSPCNLNCCNGIYVWKEGKRIHILFVDEQYLIVLEERKGYYLLVTAYYVSRRHQVEKLKKRYEKAKDA